MVARIWRGATRASDADAYVEVLRATGVKDLRATEGNRGVWVFRRIHGDRADFLVLSLWESLDAVRRFAGDDAEKAVFYPEDEAYLVEHETAATHYEVTVAQGPSA